MKRKLLLASLVFTTALVAAQIATARATLPQIMNVDVVTEHGHLVLCVRIWNLWSTEDHYTDIVEFNVNGVSDFVYLCSPGEGVLDVRYDTQLANEPLAVQVRAHCTGHSWGEWSVLATFIPEFPSIYPFLLLVASVIMTSLLRKRMFARTGKAK